MEMSAFNCGVLRECLGMSPCHKFGLQAGFLLTMGEKKQFGHIRLRHRASRAELGLGEGPVQQGQPQHPDPQALLQALG